MLFIERTLSLRCQLLRANSMQIGSLDTRRRPPDLAQFIALSDAIPDSKVHEAYMGPPLGPTEPRWAPCLPYALLSVMCMMWVKGCNSPRMTVDYNFMRTLQSSASTKD